MGNSKREDTSLWVRLECQNSIFGIYRFHLPFPGMAFIKERVQGLLKAKNWQQTDLALSMAIDANLLAKLLGGFKKLDTRDLRRIAEAIESTSDYLIGLGDDYRAGGDTDHYAFASAKMSFAYFERDISVPVHQKQLCRIVWQDDALMIRPGAPMTSEEWKLLADMIERATPSIPRIGSSRS